jgi:adenylosuccinate synthase
VRVLDLKHPERLRSLVSKAVAHANAVLASFNVPERAEVDGTITLLERLAPRILPITEDVGLMIHRAITSGANVLLEGAQGSLLDVDHGTYPYVTSSSTTSGGAAIGVGIAPTAIHAALGIVKAYTTRVGNGPLPTELDEVEGERMRQLGNEFGATTGRPRRCGWFDGVVVRYAARVNGLTGLAVTKLDVLDTFEKVALCTGYKVGQEIYTEFPGDLTALETAEPQYEWMEGWQTSTAGARSLDQLPGAARRYLDRIESLVETPITYVSVGTRRDQIIGV